MSRVSLKGICDMHVHTNPDLRHRAYSDLELADPSVLGRGPSSSRVILGLRSIVRQLLLSMYRNGMGTRPISPCSAALS